MKPWLLIAFCISRSFSSAADPEQVPPPPQAPPPQAPHAWLGLQIAKPDASITAHLPSLPLGIGFVIRAVQKDGPAQAAGLQELDLLWKLNDQWLVNEGQLAALLRLEKIGNTITLSGFRAGKPLETTVTLAEDPSPKRPFPQDLLDASILPGDCGGPMRVVNVAERLASYSTRDGYAQVQRQGDQYRVKIQDPKNAVIYEGTLPENGNLDAVPEPWRKRIHALRRGLDHALEGRMTPTRQPRPRVVPLSTPIPSSTPP